MAELPTGHIGKSIWPDMPSGPIALLGLRCRINDIILSSSIDTLSILLSVCKTSGGRALLFTISVHWREKKSLKSLAFCAQSKIKVLPDIIGGI